MSGLKEAKFDIESIVGREPPEVKLPDEVVALGPRLSAEQAMRPLRTNGPSFVPLQEPQFRRVQTLHEGVVDYARQWNFYVRRDVGGSEWTSNLRKEPNFFAAVEPYQRPEMARLRDIITSGNGFPDSETDRCDDEFRDYQRLLVAWSWFGQNVRLGPLDVFGEYLDRHPRDGWPGAKWFVEQWDEMGHLLVGACNDRSVCFAVLCLALGIQPWRMGIFTARYPEAPDLPAPSHVYNGVYLYGRWRYLDVGWTNTGLFPARTLEEVHSGWMEMNIGAVPGCDYRHPFSAEQPQMAHAFGLPQFRLAGVPILGEDPCM